MSILKGRMNFLGFETFGNGDTKTHEVEVGTVNERGIVFYLEMIRSRKVPDGDFLVAKVELGNRKEPLWKFPKDFDGIGVLAKAGSDTVIALVGRVSGKVERVVSLTNLVHSAQPDLRSQINRKREAGKFLGRECVLTTTEVAITKIDAERVVAEEARREAAEAADRKAAREARIKKIHARGTVNCATIVGGQKRYGYPVLPHEWQSLPHGTFVVLVEDIGENGAVGKFIEAFQVMKAPGQNPKKGNSVPVTVLSAPLPKVEPLRTAVVEHQGGVYEVQIYRSQDDIDLARRAGLNGGTLVAVEVGDRTTKLSVMSVHHDGVKSVGQFVAIA